MTADLLTSFAKPILAIALAGVAWVANAVAPEFIEDIPRWVDNLGLPLTFLSLVIYALMMIHRCWRDSEKGRREDLKNYATKLEAIAEKGNDTRTALILATKEQTAEFKSLIDHMKSRPCQRD